MSQHARRKAGRLSSTLAAASVLMILVAVGAAFVPTSKSGKLPPGVGSQGRFQLPPASAASDTPSASPTPSPSHTPAAVVYPRSRTTPVGQVVYPAAPRTWPAPVRTYPAPVRTYPAPDPPPDPPPPSYPPPPPSSSPPPGSDLPPPQPLVAPLAGVVTTDVAAWDANTASHAQLAVSYVSMASPLAPTFLHSAMRVANGAEPVIELMLRDSAANSGSGITLAQVASGQADAWLTELRAEIDALARPVILSFAPEPNGNWYAWGGDPAGFKAAWQHVHAVIGTADVLWMWQVSAHNIGDPATGDIGAYWPGRGYVDWVGLDGYDYQPGDNFALRFNHTLAEVKGWWTGPVIIAETAVSPATKNMPKDVTDLFAGVAANPQVIGLIYFDLKPTCPPECGFYHPDFRLEQYPAALAAYRTAVNGSW